VVTFTYIDPHRSFDPYIAHLRQYRPLFQQLRSLQFFYIATRWGRHQEAGELFPMLVEDKGLAEVIRFFEVQARLDHEQYHWVPDADLIFRNEVQKRFRGQIFETMNRLWRRNQLPKELEPQQALFMPKQKILFHSIVVAGQEGIFGDSPKRWGDGCVPPPASIFVADYLRPAAKKAECISRMVNGSDFTICVTRLATDW
jgi:hypothetical protein